jgi:hypothetical protein
MCFAAGTHAKEMGGALGWSCCTQRPLVPPKPHSTIEWLFTISMLPCPALQFLPASLVLRFTPVREAAAGAVCGSTAGSLDSSWREFVELALRCTRAKPVGPGYPRTVV